MKNTNKVKSSVSLGLFFIVFCAGGCASNGNRVAAGECPVPDLGVTEYIIGTGDSLLIDVWRSPELSTTVLVRPDGRVTTPLVDDMAASGKTTSALASDIEVVLSEFLRSPEVSVMVATQGTANQIQVVGEVNAPISVSYRNELKLLDVIVAVGGLTDFAAGNRSKIVRVVNGQSFECRVRVENVLQGDMTENINLYGGDVLVIPETRF